jgi:general secretion pathway protein A
MYESFYGLRERPFNLTPDPKYLYLSDKHKEAFAHLLFGIKNRSGFVMVTGEIGTGKTTICRNLINQLNQDVNLALIFNPSLNPVELMQKINAEFGIEHNATNVRELGDILNSYLLEQAALDHTCVLIIDEAQNLSPAVLEQIRLLSNLETETEKLLQIILIGQPELADKLALHELRQLNQRITARYHLKALDQKETQQYIQYRLHVAGGRRKLKFTPATVRTIFQHSKGTPRVINAVCDRCLLIGYTKETHTITPRIARQAIRELRGTYSNLGKGLRTWLRSMLPSPAMLVTAAVVVILLGVAGMFFAQPVQNLAQELGAFNRILTNNQPPAEGAPAAPASAPNVAEAVTEPAPTAAAAAPPVVAAVMETIARNNPPAPAAPAPDAFLDAIRARDALEGGAAALLAAWDIPLNGNYPPLPALEVMRDFGQRHGLKLEKLQPALDQLLAINLPAMVKVKSGTGTAWIALVGAAADKVTVVSAKGERVELPRDIFAQRYEKDAYIFWRDPAPRTTDLTPGKSGKHVADFKRQLRELGRLDSSNTSDVYDPATATAVSQIQSESGLLLDGLAGQQVRMVLSSWLGDSRTPRLDPQRDGRLAQAAEAEAQPAGEEKPAPKSAAKAAPKAEPVKAAPARSDVPPVQPDIHPLPSIPAELPAPEAPAPAAPEAPAEAAPEPATAPEPVVRVQELGEPVAGEFVPERSDARKETTPPLDGSAPLVPAG